MRSPGPHTTQRGNQFYKQAGRKCLSARVELDIGSYITMLLRYRGIPLKSRLRISLHPSHIDRSPFRVIFD